MATYNKELARKIIRLLESDHDGEAAAAARKLTEMAKKQSHNLDEMLAAIYGSAAPKASSGSSPVTAWEAAETFRKAKAKAAADTAADMFNWGATRRAKPKAPHCGDDEKLQELREAFDEWGPLPLTAWERIFVDGIIDRGSDVLSDKQTEVIDKILAKYKSFAARNGDEKSFWGA